MKSCHLLPPDNGLNADPLLYGVAAGIAELFPLPDEPANTTVLRSPSEDNSPLEVETDIPTSE